MFWLAGCPLLGAEECRLKPWKSKELLRQFLWSYSASGITFRSSQACPVLFPVWPFPGDQACGCIPEPSSQFRLFGGCSRSDAPFIGRHRHKPCLLDHGWDPASCSKAAVPMFTLLASCDLRNSRFVKLQQVCSKHSLTYVLSAVDCTLVAVQHAPWGP